MNTKISELLDRVEQFSTNNAAEIEDFRVKMIGKKGELTALMEEFKGVAPELKREYGQKLNALKQAILAKIEPAMIWKTGLTYYYTMINHFGDADGVVRNHSYDVNITAFHGLGTPIFEKDDFYIIPEIPVEQKAYNLTAQINVLSWALVSNDVELGM